MGKLGLYIDYFKDKLFSKKNEPKTVDFEEERFEKWIFSEADPRFESEKTDDYETVIDGKNKKISITANRKNVYAWTVNNKFRYKDFAADFTVTFANDTAQVEIDKAGTCAGGLLCRYINDNVFYALLISDHGWVRMDVMVNGTPIPMLAWTKPVNYTLGTPMQVRFISVDTKFHILINNNWVATVENNVIQSAGKIAVAVQNWETFSQSTCIIQDLQLTSEIERVENLDTEAGKLADTDYAAHINVAQSFYAMGKYDEAVAELNKAETIQPITPADSLLAGQVYFSLERTEDAEKAYIAALESEENFEAALPQLAGLYYYSGNFEALGNLLDKQKEKYAKLINESAILQNFAGHYYHWAKDSEAALACYKKAFELKNTEGVFALNVALEYEVLLDENNAYEFFLRAGYAFLRAEDYTELAKVVNKLESISKEDERTLSLLGKFYYGIENYPQAGEYFTKLCEKLKTKDASNWYLYALLTKDQDYKRYVTLLEKAAKLDKTSSLYFFRLAEAQFNSDADCTKALETALKLDDKNAWAYNLKALYFIKSGDLEAALQNVQTARKLLPDEIDLLTNYVEIKRLQGKLSELTPLFDIHDSATDIAVERNRGKAFHIFANALYKEGMFEQAADWYAKAEKLLPNNTDLLLNHAQNSMELSLLNEADTFLVKALDLENSVEVYRLIAKVSRLKGNYLRVEATINEGLSFYPDNADLLFDLAQIQLQFNKKDKAAETVKKLSKLEKSDRVKELGKLIDRK